MCRGVSLSASGRALVRWRGRHAPRRPEYGRVFMAGAGDLEPRDGSHDEDRPRRVHLRLGGDHRRPHGRLLARRDPEAAVVAREAEVKHAARLPERRDRPASVRPRAGSPPRTYLSPVQQGAPPRWRSKPYARRHYFTRGSAARAPTSGCGGCSCVTFCNSEKYM